MLKYLSVRDAPNLQRLDARFRDDVLGHMLALDSDARYMRFGNHASDDFIKRYVAGIDFEQDLVLGWLYGRGDLLAVVHLAHINGAMTEFSISITESLRGVGHGQSLTQDALRMANELGYGSAHVQFLNANKPMAAIIDHFAGSHEVDGPERLVNVPLPAVMRRPFNFPLGPLACGGFAF